MRHDRASQLTSRQIYRGRVIEVFLDRVRLPHGRDVELEVVRHAGSVVLLPMPAPNQLILIRQYRYAINQWIWELPAGGLAPGENPEDAARRECQEEINLFPDRLESLGEYFPTPGFCDERMIFYKALSLHPPASPAERDEDECLEVECFTWDQIRELVEAGQIRDMKTALGLRLIAAHPR